MSVKLMDAFTAVGVSRPWRSHGVVDHQISTHFKSLAATKISAVTIKFQGSATNSDGETGVISDPVIAIGSTAENVANDAFDYRVQNVNYSKAAVVAGTAFTAAHVIAASKWGAVNLYIDTSGTITTKVTGVQTGTQSYDTASDAHTAADAVVGAPEVVYIGRVLILNDGSEWTAGTDDLTDASDVTTATFISATSSYRDIVTHAFDADEITAQKALFHVTSQGDKYIRTYLSTLTGTGEVDNWYSSSEA